MKNAREGFAGGVDGGFFLNPQNNKGPELAVAEPLDQLDLPVEEIRFTTQDEVRLTWVFLI